MAELRYRTWCQYSEKLSGNGQYPCDKCRSYSVLLSKKAVQHAWNMKTARDNADDKDDSEHGTRYFEVSAMMSS